MSQGWIKIDRAIASHWVWKEEFSKGQAWVDLLLHANHSDAKVMIKGRIITVKKGQQIRSEVTLSKTWSWSRDRVRRFLSLLRSDEMITTETIQVSTRITICNYSKYQVLVVKDNTGNDTPNKTANKTGVDTQTRMLKNEKKKDIRDPFDFKDWPEKPSEELFEEIIQHRKSVKAKPPTQRIVTAMGKTLHELSVKGISMDVAMETYLTSSWMGLQTKYFNNHESNEPADQPPTDDGL